MIPELLKQVEKIDAIINGLLNFAKPGPTAKQPLPIVDILASTISLMEGAFEEKNILLRRTNFVFNPLVNADRQLLQQAFLHILKNACDAFDVAKQDKYIEIALAHHCISDPGSFRDSDSQYEMVEIAIRDNGSGIDQQQLEMVFNPFYTTKYSGVGLGLATAHRIIEEHEGAITVTSIPGRETVFRVSLPVSRA